ncbi:zinc transporter ZIP1 [Halyomorpha halys]|uniref:zinc transporter ZIP1 n=1 Tax=Halyomorpha halys TaxID=286706 RepID=UPI0006D4FE23
MKYAEFENQTRSEEAEGLVVAKLSAMAVLGVSSFVLGILPIKLAACLRWKDPPGHGHQGHQPLVISLLLCFGGGVLLYTTFMHLQPEVRESMSSVLKTGIIPQAIVETGINLSELIFCIGFFFVYLIEEVVHTFLDKTHPEEDEEVLHRTLSVRRCHGNMIPRINLNKSQNTSPPSTITASTQVLIRDYNKKNSRLEPVMTEPSETASSSSEPVSVVKSFRGLLAVMALSFHAVFEGLAVGLEKNAASVWYLCAAIATHKLVIAFCIGIELVSSRTKPTLILVYIATFALVSPLGIGLGLIISTEGALDSPPLALASVILQGMAAGTLLYVVFFEVLQREKSHSRYGLAQLLAIMAGFIVMIALGIFIGHQHTHFQDDHHDHHGHAHAHDHEHEHEHR